MIQNTIAYQLEPAANTTDAPVTADAMPAPPYRLKLSTIFLPPPHYIYRA